MNTNLKKGDIMEIKTCKLWKSGKTYRAKNTLYLNATIKSGVKSFAPTWSMVKDYKEGKLGAKAYTKKYRAKMLASQKKRPELWDKLANYTKIVIGCYCKEGAFCHRRLLAIMIFEYQS